MCFGLAWILRIEEGYPQVIEDLRGVGRDLERILECRDGLVHISLHKERTPKVAVGKGVGGIEGDRCMIELNSLIQVGLKQLGGFVGATGSAECNLPGS